MMSNECNYIEILNNDIKHVIDVWIGWDKIMLKFYCFNEKLKY